MSVRVGDKIIIKRRGAQLGQRKPTDFVVTRFQGKDSGIMRASTELIVHRAIYEKTSALAIIHCHPWIAITLSLSRDEIIPIDNEGSYLLRKIPVVSVEMASGSAEMAKTVSEALQGYKIIMLRGAQQLVLNALVLHGVRTLRGLFVLIAYSQIGSATCGLDDLIHWRSWERYVQRC